MAKTKGMTKRFIEATFRRGRAKSVPADYLKSEMAKFCPDQEMAKFDGLLAEMVAEGKVIENEDGYTLVKEAAS